MPKNLQHLSRWVRWLVSRYYEWIRIVWDGTGVRYGAPSVLIKNWNIVRPKLLTPFIYSWNENKLQRWSRYETLGPLCFWKCFIWWETLQGRGWCCSSAWCASSPGSKTSLRSRSHPPGLKHISSQTTENIRFRDERGRGYQEGCRIDDDTRKKLRSMFPQPLGHLQTMPTFRYI